MYVLSYFFYVWIFTLYIVVFALTKKQRKLSVFLKIVFKAFLKRILGSGETQKKIRGHIPVTKID